MTIAQQLTKLMCHLFGHDYKLLRKISPTVRELKCGRCKQEFGMNDNVQALLPLDDELRDCHAVLIGHYMKSNKRTIEIYGGDK